MKIVFTVIDENGNEHNSKPINGFENWKQVGLGAIIHTHQTALKLGVSVKIKSIKRIDI